MPPRCTVFGHPVCYAASCSVIDCCRLLTSLRLSGSESDAVRLTPNSLFNRILHIFLFHINLRMVRDIQTAGGHIIVCNPDFRARRCFTTLCAGHPITDPCWKKSADSRLPLPQHSPGALASGTCSDELFSLLPARIRNRVIFSSMPKIINYRLMDGC